MTTAHVIVFLAGLSVGLLIGLVITLRVLVVARRAMRELVKRKRV